MSHPLAKVHRMSELVEPIGAITFSEVPNEEFLALGMRSYWDGYFAGRAAPLGLAPAEVVHAVFYNFADGEVARHIPWVWGKITPQEALAVRERGSAAALRLRIGELADSAGLVRVADLATRAAVSAPTEGRALYAGLRALDVPEQPAARLCTRRRCCGSTAGTATTPSCSPTASAAPRPTSSSLSPSE